MTEVAVFFVCKTTDGKPGHLVGSAPDLWSKGCKFKSWQKQKNFLLCADSSSVSIQSLGYHSGTFFFFFKQSFCQKRRWQVTTKDAHTLDLTKLEWANYAVAAQCGNLSAKISTEATCQGSLSKSFSACWATVDWSWPKVWDQCLWADFHLKKKSAGGEWIAEPSPKPLQTRKKPLTTQNNYKQSEKK